MACTTDQRLRALARGFNKTHAELRRGVVGVGHLVGLQTYLLSGRAVKSQSENFKGIGLLFRPLPPSLSQSSYKTARYGNC